MKHFRDHVLLGIKDLGRTMRAEENILEEFRSRWNVRLVDRCFYLWQKDTMRYCRSEVVTMVDQMDTSYFRNRKTNVLKIWSALSLGMNSRKGILQRRRDAMATARERLTERLMRRKDEENGMIITNDMVRAEMQLIFYGEMRGWVRTRYLTRCLASWRNRYEIYRDGCRRADGLFCSKVCGTVLVAWRDAARLIRITPPRYNPAAAEAFPRLVSMRRTLAGWSAVTARLVAARRIRRRVLSRFARAHLVAWGDAAVRRRTLRAHAAQSWWDLHGTISINPLRQWAKWAAVEGRRTWDLSRLADMSSKSIERRFLARRFRAWRHQAKYGRVTGLGTRAQLFQSFLDERRRREALERRLEKERGRGDEKMTGAGGRIGDGTLMGELPSAGELVRHPEPAPWDLECARQRQQAEEQISGLTEALRRAEEEASRMKRVVDCVKEVAPEATEYLSRMLPFLERHVQEKGESGID